MADKLKLELQRTTTRRWSSSFSLFGGVSINFRALLQPEMLSALTRFINLLATQPTPDPSQEGNKSPCAAPLLEGVGGGFMGLRRGIFRWRILSPRRGKSLSHVWKKSVDDERSPVLKKFLPLLGGEGRGEGERFIVLNY
ncbi:MAG: hypothetical protein HY298_25185 [Verrucomicrobia bacterium]|nr:hypothetical protein [Verrucomicrobiota bacterium]